MKYNEGAIERLKKVLRPYNYTLLETWEMFNDPEIRTLQGLLNNECCKFAHPGGFSVMLVGALDKSLRAAVMYFRKDAVQYLGQTLKAIADRHGFVRILDANSLPPCDKDQSCITVVYPNECVDYDQVTKIGRIRKMFEDDGACGIILDNVHKESKIYLDLKAALFEGDLVGGVEADILEVAGVNSHYVALIHWDQPKLMIDVGYTTRMATLTSALERRGYRSWVIKELSIPQDNCYEAYLGFARS